MAVHSARSFRTGWITAAYCSCLLAGGVGLQPAAARAQMPASPARAFQVEQWQGNNRVGAEPPRTPSPILEPTTPPAFEPPGAPLPPVRSDVPWTPPPPFTSLSPAPAPLITPVTATKEPPHAATPAQLKDLGQQLIRSTGKLADDCQSALDSCATSLRSSGDRLVETLTVPVRTKAERQQATTTVVYTPAPTGEKSGSTLGNDDSLPWYKVVWLQVVVGGSALVVGPLMVALMLGLMLRRSGLQLRVEVVNSGLQAGLGVAYGITRIDTTQPDVPARPVGRIEPDLGGLASVAAAEAVPFGEPKEPEEPEFNGEQFDLGPSYEEERLAKEAAEDARAQAILQEIFEENMKLQEELRAQEQAESVVPPIFEESAVAALMTDSDDLISEPVGYLTDEQDQTV